MPSTGQDIRYHVDHWGSEEVAGWAVHESGIKEIRVFANGKLLKSSRCSSERPDVYRAYPGVKDSLRSGFVIPVHHLGDRVVTDVTVEIAANDGAVARQTIPNLFCHKEGIEESAFRPGIDQPIRSGFPFAVSKILARYRPDVYPLDRTWSDELMVQAVADLKRLSKQRVRVAAFNRYIFFLQSMAQKIAWIWAHFPPYNHRAPAGSKDSRAIASSSTEMLTLANQLYVLKSNGLSGRFLEFGCFKGFSSSCLSHACHELGIRMEIFDSFAGLPPSDSDFYHQGEFCGMLGEVSGNIAEFGQPGVVSYHQGFFADTVPHFEKHPILCIWMDVDLISSARDVVPLLKRLPRNSVLFSHESVKESFDTEPINPALSEVFPPILEQFAALGWQVRGRHIDVALAAFWDRHQGIPVLPESCLLELTKFE